MKILDVLNSPWAISHQRLIEIQSIYRAHFRGEKIDWKALEAKDGLFKNSAKYGKPYDVINGIAVIDISGVLTKSMSFFSWLFGGSSMQQIAQTYQAAVADPQVKSVLLSIDSPGGTVDGTQELANLIYSGKNDKPVVAYSNGMIASAAYWIASAADKIYISGDTVEIGSIGVVATHVDVSKQDEMFGEKYTEITAGTYKRIASSHSTLSPEGRQTIQDQVDHIYTIFVGEVARNRNISEEQSLDMANGKIFLGKQAIEVGLVDGVATFDRIINSLSSGETIIHAEGETQIMDLNELKEKHHDVYRAAFDQGKAEATSTLATQIEAAQAAGISTGAETERKRISEIQAQAVPGHESIIEAAIADGKSTAGDVALKIVAAEKVLRTQKGKEAETDAAVLNKVTVTNPPAVETAGPVVDQNLPVEERAKAEWDQKPEIRAEFRTIEAYTAFKKADESGKVKILGRK
jgi:signal peptide peptidase SppA